MSLLAIETSGNVCSVAVLPKDGPPVLRSFPHDMRLLRSLVVEVDHALKQASLPLSRLSGIAVNVGPGSFTGLRIGVTTAKMWALALDLPVWAVSGLQALAWSISHERERLILSAIPARPGRVYAAAYRCTKGFPQQMALPPGLYETSNLPGLLPGPLPAIVGPCAADLVRFYSAQEGTAVEAGTLNALTVGMLAVERRSRGEFDPAISLAPLYLAEPNITTPGRQRARNQ